MSERFGLATVLELGKVALQRAELPAEQVGFSSNRLRSLGATAQGDGRCPCGCRVVEESKGTTTERERARRGRAYQLAWKCSRVDSTPRGAKRKRVRLAELSRCRKAHERVCALVDAGLPEGCLRGAAYSKDAQTVARLSSLAENGLGAQLPRLSAATVEAIEELQAGRSSACV